MIYENARVLREDFTWETRDVCVRGGRIREAEASEPRVDASGYSVVPALTDIHSHGACGVCANDVTKDAYDTLCAHMKRHGIHGFLPTVITGPAREMLGVCRMYADYHARYDTVASGLNLEGPFINAAKKGAHNQHYILDPDIELFRQMYDASQGQVKLVTVAPELPGAIPFIKEASKLCRVAVGHSAADYDTAMRAFEAGATDVTHLFNAMNPMGHRSPGIVAAARDSGAYVELICDGKHIHPSVVRMVFSAFDKDRVVLISDAISATGLPDGVYELGGLKTIVKDGTSTLEDGTLAGSTADLLGCVKQAVAFGIPLEDAVRAASQNPCRLIGRKSDTVIVLDQGMDLVVEP